jgi:tyrosyl-tRNA synthetase
MAPANDMYGKVMSLPDQAMGDYARLVTRWSPKEIKEFDEGLTTGRVHPRDAKMKIAREIVEIFRNPEEAAQAETAFIRVFQKQKLPEDMPTYTLQPGQTVLDVLQAGGLVNSRGEGRRLITQNGIRLDGETLNQSNQPFPHPGVLQAGKRRFLRVTEN